MPNRSVKWDTESLKIATGEKDIRAPPQIRSEREIYGISQEISYLRVLISDLSQNPS